MSKNKIGEAAEVADTRVETAVFTTKAPKDPTKPRGPNVTPKSVMHIGRDWSEASWRQAWASYCKKLDRESFMKRKEVK